MILVTVGSQLSFDRLMTALDEWASRHPDVDIFAQTGPTERPPGHLRHADFVSPEEIESLYKSADLIVSHAGMGSILAALKHRKPIVILPRREALMEHRNDHQYATAQRFANTPGVFVAWEESDIAELLDKRSELHAGGGISDYASSELIGALSRFINDS